MDGILSIKQKHGLYLIEDCAQAHGHLIKINWLVPLVSLVHLVFILQKIWAPWGCRWYYL